MTIHIDERFLSRDQTEGEQRSAELVYLARCDGGENEIEAKYATIDHAPASYDGMVQNGAQVEQINATMYEVAIQYGSQSRAETNAPTWTFDTTGGTRKITQALEHLGDYAPPGQTAPNHGGTIGVTPDGTVEGVEVPAPAAKYTETHVFHKAFVTNSYLLTLAGMTGSVNNCPFRGLGTGEVMFLGATTNVRDEDYIEITFNFDLSANAYNVPVGDITIPAKFGWDYAWVEYTGDEDATAKRMIQRASAAHLERVAPFTNFAFLGIGLA